MKKGPTDDLLTVSQAAARLKVSRQNLYDAISRGRLSAIKIGKLVLVHRSALETYRKSRKRTGRPTKHR